MLGVNGSLVRGMCDLSPAASKRFPGVLGDTAGVICCLGLLFERLPLLAQCINLDVHLYYVAIQNLVYGYGNVPQSTAESSVTPLIHCAQHVQQSVDMSINFPQAYNATTFKWLKLFNRTTYWSAGHCCTLD